MRKSTTGKLAAAAAAVVSATALAALAAPGASAATTTASALDRSSRAGQATAPCVDRTFSTRDENTYSGCVKGEQMLLNGIRWTPFQRGVPVLTEDGHYGALTARVVAHFQGESGLTADGITGYNTWFVLCGDGLDEPPYYRNVWYDVGCGETGALPPR